MKILIILPMLFVLFFFNFSFLGAQTATTHAPENLEEAKKIGEEALRITQEKLPGRLETMWKEQVLPVWSKMYGWFLKNIWEKYVVPFYEKEIRARQPAIEEEFQKEKEEMKNEIPAVGKSIWERFKDLIK